MSKTVIFLSHTDIRFDSRILKSMEHIKRCGFIVKGIGIADKSSTRNYTKELDIVSLILRSRNLTMFPSTIRHALVYFEFFLKLVFLLRKMKFEIIHCNDVIPLLPSLYFKIVRNCSFYYDAHELESDKNSQSALNRFSIRIIERLVWSYVDALIVVSRSIQLWYIADYGWKKSVVVLNSPVIITEEIFSNNYLRDLFNLRDETKIFIYNGYLMNGRWLLKLVEYFSSSNLDICLVLLGDGVLKDKLMEIATKNVYFHDFCEHNLVSRINQSADFGLCMIEPVSLSDYYCLPNKLFEYYYAGVKIIGSKLPEIEKFIIENSAGYTSDLTFSDFNDVILNCVNETSISVNVNYTYSWESQKLNLNKIY
jgi:glycosyltransferase involved in cell wall biosynthesis